MSKLTRAEKKVINRDKHRRMSMARHSRRVVRKTTKKTKRRSSYVAKRAARSTTIQGRRRHYKLYRKAGSKATRAHIISAVRGFGVSGPASLKRWIRSKGRKNPGAKTLHDGSMMSKSRSGRTVYITLTSPYGEVYEYETTGAKATRVAAARSFASAKRILGGSMLRSINPRVKRRTTRSTNSKRSDSELRRMMHSDRSRVRALKRFAKRSARTGRFVRR